MGQHQGRAPADGTAAVHFAGSDGPCQRQRPRRPHRLGSRGAARQALENGMNRGMKRNSTSTRNTFVFLDGLIADLSCLFLLAYMMILLPVPLLLLLLLLLLLC